MHSYRNARLTKKGRLRLINQHLLHPRPLGRTLHSQRNWRAAEPSDQLLYLRHIGRLLGGSFLHRGRDSELLSLGRGCETWSQDRQCSATNEIAWSLVLYLGKKLARFEKVERRRIDFIRQQGRTSGVG